MVSSAFRAFDTAPGEGGNTGAGGNFSKEQIERFRCQAAAGAEYGTPAGAMDISCNTREYRQDFNPDNELAVAVNPFFPEHVVAGSNDYYYRFNNSTGARQALVPTGFFTTFDGGATWVDGQIPTRSGNGAGDPAPAFVGERSDPTNPRRGSRLRHVDRADAFKYTLPCCWPEPAIAARRPRSKPPSRAT